MNKIILCIFLIGYFHQYETCIQVSEPPISTTTPPTTVPKLKEDSVILTSEEKANLQNITGYNGNLTLLWRGTRDGFSAATYHSKCDGKANTITIIKSTLNYVFGGYTSASWESHKGYVFDSNAYLFLLRVNGSSTALKYSIEKLNGAIYNSIHYGPTFGDGHDIRICDYPNLYRNSYTYCRAYKCPDGVSKESHHSKLAGSNSFLVSEIEVFQMD